ncbi:hypothetical protein, partial [Mesorhizobium sp. SP-1A]|uniref:hypothetical protein n=1 Tax=Mesorhizobium sp. SP-1A TaxID=3077840 RepID=UPI0028F6C25C
MALPRLVNMLLRGLALAGSCSDRRLSERIAEAPRQIPLDQILAAFPDLAPTFRFDEPDAKTPTGHAPRQHR